MRVSIGEELCHQSWDEGGDRDENYGHPAKYWVLSVGVPSTDKTVNFRVSSAEYDRIGDSMMRQIILRIKDAVEISWIEKE
jgi:hypothetical protein